MTTARPRERVGRLFQEGELVVEIENTDDLEVEILLKEGQAARVVPGQEVDLLARAFPFQTLHARVVRVAPVAHRTGERTDGTTPAGTAPTVTATDAEGLIAVYCVLKTTGVELRPGMTGHARIHRGERPAGTVLSENAMRMIRIEFWR
jgi:multidrug resistance efflux pump